MKKQVKSLLGKAAYAFGLSGPVLADRGIIVLFHRVDDRLKTDPISCGVTEFRNYCRYFKKHFEVISLDEMLERTANGGSLKGTLAITFDDGYLDNATAAAPILLELGLPATFYISTDFIESPHRPWWDEKLPFQPEWMSWNQVRGLRDQGFSIGGHTMTHVDLGTVDVETADREIRGCKARLEAELDQPISHFSFPYGRRENIRSETLALVKAAGFRSCVSAFGGLVATTKDLFTIPREPISPWYDTPDQFGFELLARYRHREPPTGVSREATA